MIGKPMTIRNYLSTIAWCMAVVGYYFQFPIPQLSSMIVPGVALYLVLELPNMYISSKKHYLFGLAGYLFLLLICAVRSLIIGVSLTRIIRFAAILIMLPVSCWVRDTNFSIKKKLFSFFSVAKSLLIIIIAVDIIQKGDYTGWRAWVEQNGMGDIYFRTRWLPKIQVHGNALLLVAVFLGLTEKKKPTLSNIINVIGVLFAGNFAFILGLCLFFCWQVGSYLYSKIKSGMTNKKVLVAVVVLLILCCAVLMPIFWLQIQQKLIRSFPTRVDQASVLIKANPFIGEGLGSIVIAETATRNYNGDIYFELQTLYIYNQIGFIGLALAYFLTVFPVVCKSKKYLLLYLMYLMYSFWNPYCWDTTHIIALILFMNFENQGEEYDKGNCYNLLSFVSSKRKY